MKKMKREVGARYKISLSVVMLIFLMISWCITNQSYAGIIQIRGKVQQYDIPHNTILTNSKIVSYIFNESDVDIIRHSNITELSAMISQQRYDCIIVLHHNRGFAYQFSDEAIEVFQRHYRNSASFGSSFSNVEIFYN